MLVWRQRGPLGSLGGLGLDPDPGPGTKGSYLWDRGILMGQRDPIYGTMGFLLDKGILMGAQKTQQVHKY